MLILTIFFIAIMIACAFIPGSEYWKHRKEWRDMKHVINRYSERVYINHEPRQVVKSNIFGRCRCGGLEVHGICQACGHAAVCCVCRKVRQPDENWKVVPHDPTNDSHGFCNDDFKRLYPDIYSKRKVVTV